MKLLAPLLPPELLLRGPVLSISFSTPTNCKDRQTDSRA
jgi:hypothetical protein